MTRASSRSSSFDELARLAFALEHPGGHGIALPALDPPVRVEHRPVERNERRGGPTGAQSPCARQVTHDDRVADERAHEGLVFRREAERIGEAHDERIVGDHRRARACTGHEARMMRHDGGPSLAPARKVLEEHDPTRDVLDDDVLQTSAEQPGQRVGELRRSLDSIRHQAGDASVASADNGLGTRPDAIETRVHLLEGAVSRPLLRELALALVERPLLDLDDLLELGEALLEPALLGRRGHPSGSEVVDRSRKLLGASGVLDACDVE